MDKRIRIVRDDSGMTICDDRTGLRLEVYELPSGLSLEAYGYHSGAHLAVRMHTHEETAVEGRRANPSVTFEMPDPKPVPARPGRWTAEPMISWKLGQSSIERAGGILRLSALCRRLVGRRFHFEESELYGWIGVRVVVEREVKTKTGNSYRLAEWDEWITQAGAARSPTVLEDQRDVTCGDLLALEPIIRAEVARLSEEVGLSELELRYLYGDR